MSVHVKSTPATRRVPIASNKPGEMKRNCRLTRSFGLSPPSPSSASLARVLVSGSIDRYEVTPPLDAGIAASRVDNRLLRAGKLLIRGR